MCIDGINGSKINITLGKNYFLILKWIQYGGKDLKCEMLLKICNILADTSYLSIYLSLQSLSAVIFYTTEIQNVKK
jgi:hypothetical protein